MKTKLRRFVSIFSAMVLMVCCAVPAFAFSNSDLPVGDYNSNDDTSYKEIISQLITKYPDYFKNYVFMLPQSDSSYSQYGFYWFNCDDSNNFEIVKNGDNFYLKNTDNKSFKAYRCFWNYRRSEFSQVYLNGESSSNNDYALAWQIYTFGSNCNVKIGDDDLIKDPNAPPVPFTVDYSPSLKTGLVRKGTLVAPGASNDGQEVETNTIAVTVKLTDAFLNASKPISGAYTYSYQFTCFVVPSEYKDSDIKTMSEHAIYTAAQDNLHYLYYENETLDVDDSLSSEPATGPDIVPVSEQWANATGVSNCFLLERDSNNTPLRNVTIDLHNIDFEKHKSDSYNIVVLGHIVRKSEYGWTAYPSYFKSDCSSLALESTKEYPMNFGSSEQPVVNKNFYDYYSVVSADWSFKDYPKFEPHKVGGVTVGDSPLDFKRTAKGVQDYNMWEQGGTDNTLKPDDFDKYKEQKKLDENFGSVDFGLDSIKSVFDGSSDFFKFLTASIGILPTTFLTILISFFVIMLAICVVKWVLK